MSVLNSRIQLSILNRTKEPGLIQKGFTLVELMIVIVIVGILSAIALPNFLNNTTKAKATEAKTKISAILKDAHAEYQLDGNIDTAVGAADEQAEDNNSDNFTYKAADTGTDGDDQVTVTAEANPSADGGDATLVTAEADGTPLDGCVNLTTGKIEIRKSFKDDTDLNCGKPV